MNNLEDQITLPDDIPDEELVWIKIDIPKNQSELEWLYYDRFWVTNECGEKWVSENQGETFRKVTRWYMLRHRFMLRTWNARIWIFELLYIRIPAWTWSKFRK